MSYKFNNDYISITIESSDNLMIKIKGHVLNPNNYSLMELLAPNPIVKQMRYSTSGLPFANPTIAFDNTPNSLKISENGIINDVNFSYPNGYYVVGGSNKISPSVFVILHPKNNNQPLHIRLELPDILSLHTLTYRPNHAKGVMYYSVKESLVQMQGAEDTARAYAEAKLKYGLA